MEPVQAPKAPESQRQVVVQDTPPGVRYWGDEPSAAFIDWVGSPGDDPAACCAGLMDRPHSYLVISSGGVEGAFGAGLLAGWTVAGTRPEFQLVTGVSSGAMIAPFAFLGPAYDGVLREIYSNYSSSDLVERRSVFRALGSDAVMDTAPLRRLIDRYLDDDAIARIGAEARKGRRLLIGTTNLNAGRPVIWDLTKIASSGTPDARKVIGDLILASSAIPGVFPPVRIQAEAGGVRYNELHVDGGVTAQLFLSPPGVDWKRVAERFRVTGRPQVYLIRNQREYPWLTAVRTQISSWLERWTSPTPWEEVEARVSPILWRSMSSMLRTRGFHDAVQLYMGTHGTELGLNLARVPDDFTHASTEFFDRSYMQALFERGYAMARDGDPWLRSDTSISE